MSPVEPDEPYPDPARRAAGFRLLRAFLASVALAALSLIAFVWLTGGDPLGAWQFVFFLSLILGFLGWPLVTSFMAACTRGHYLRAVLRPLLLGLFVWAAHRAGFGDDLPVLLGLFFVAALTLAVFRPVLAGLSAWAVRRAGSGDRLLLLLWVLFGVGIAVALWEGLRSP